MSNHRPNYTILPATIRYDKELPSTAKIIYSELLALTGIGRQCSVSNSYFAEVFGLSEVQVSTLINLLEEKGYIAIKIYQNYRRTIKILDKKRSPQPSSKPSKPVQEEWKFEEELKKFQNSTRRDLQIIALWVVLNKFKPANKDQWKAIIERNIRAAGKLKGYSNEDITDTFNSLQRTDYIKKITLETISKYIDDIVKNEQNKKKIIRWEEVKYPDGTIKMKPVIQ